MAYLISEDENYHEILDAVFAEAYSRWGGRRTLLIPTIDGEIEDSYFNWLKWYDPDIVYSYCELNAKEIRRVDRYCQPIYFIQHKKEKDNDSSHWAMPEFPKAFLPSYSVLQKYLLGVRYFERSNKPYLVDCCLNWKDDGFVGDNFGIYHKSFPSYPPIPSVRKYLKLLTLNEEDNPHIKWDREVVKSEVELLLFLIKNPSSLSLSQLSSESPHTPVLHRHKYENSLNFVVGDGFLDRLHFWNGRLLIPYWRDGYISAMRIPKNRFEDEEYIGVLAKFINAWNKMGPQSISDSFITVRSTTLNQMELNVISEKLLEKGIKRTGRINAEILKPEFPTDRDYKESRHFVKPSEKTVRTGESPVLFNPVEPNHFSYISPENPGLKYGHWIVDLQIERDVDLSQFINKGHWWKLPRRREMSKEFYWGGDSKVSKEGFLSVIPKNRDQIFGKPVQKELFIEVNIPSDEEVFRSLSRGENIYHQDDIRFEEHPSANIEYCELSDKGKYLSGVLGLFGSLNISYQFISNLFWRKIFDEMGAYSKAKNNLNIERIKKVIKDRIGSKLDKSNLGKDETLEYISRLVVKESRNVRIPSKTIEFEELAEKWVEELNKYLEHVPQLKDQSERILSESNSDVKKSLEFLISKTIFHQGKSWSCKNCGYKNWISIEKLSLWISCQVCQRKIQISASLNWDFYLNEFFAKALREHGCMPVIWTLGKLLNKAQNSFYFFPSIKLYENYPERQNDRPFGEVDLICVLDGQFIIGEIKSSIRGFNSDEIEKIAKLSEKLEPDIVVLSCMETGGKKLEGKKDELSKKIKEINCRIETMSPEGTEFEKGSHYLPY